MKQHIGAPAVPVVAVGEKVTKGQVIGRVPEDKVGCHVHAVLMGRYNVMNIKLSSGGGCQMVKAIGLIETISIAAGIETADAMIKIAPVKLL